MNSFNANVAGYFADAYIEWRRRSDAEEEDAWEGFFDYNVGWIKRDDVSKILPPGRYKLIEEASEYEIEIEEVTPREEGIYRARFRGLGKPPLERTWRRARDLKSTLSWDEQVMQKIKQESGAKPGGCMMCLLAVGASLIFVWWLF
jgi:hypothetical protein